MELHPLHLNTIHADSLRERHLARAEQVRLARDPQPSLRVPRVNRLRAVLIALRRPDLVCDPAAH